MTQSIIAILEHQDGKIVRLSWEALAAAQKLGAALNLPVEAMVLGSGLGHLAGQVAACKVTQVINLDAAELSQYTPDAYCLALHGAVAIRNPSYVLLPHTYQVREFAPKLAARMGRAILSDCTGFRIEGGEVIFSRQLYQGKLSADLSFEGDGPYFISVQAGSFPAAQLERGENPAPVIVERVELPNDSIRTIPLERVQEAKRTVDLSQAEVIVAVGRGIKEAENLPLVEKLAAALGGQIAGSRPICDSGWLPMERQVGSSGQTVSPKLYFAIGISGAIQHLVGMKGSRTIVAINKDPNAPIFEVADFGIVANLFDVLPALTEEIIKARQG